MGTLRLQAVAFVAAAVALVPLVGAAWLKRWTEVAGWGTVAVLLLVMAAMDRAADPLDRECMAGLLRRARILGAIDPTITLHLRLDGGLALRVSFTIRRGDRAHAWQSEFAAWPADGGDLVARLERAVEDGLLGARNELYDQG
jgi:hypothetical protein